jgi:hypothetical protein
MREMLNTTAPITVRKMAGHIGPDIHICTITMLLAAPLLCMLRQGLLNDRQLYYRAGSAAYV